MHINQKTKENKKNIPFEKRNSLVPIEFNNDNTSNDNTICANPKIKKYIKNKFVLLFLDTTAVIKKVENKNKNNDIKNK